MKPESGFNVGDECYYTEEGMTARCKILGKWSDDKKFGYRLKVLEVVERGIFTIVPGEVFDAEKLFVNPGVPPGMLWEISENRP